MGGRVHSPVQIHANCVVLFDWVTEETFHQAVRSQRFLDFALNNHTHTLRPSLVLISTGLKYFTSPGLKNMYRTVDLLLLILKG